MMRQASIVLSLMAFVLTANPALSQTNFAPLPDQSGQPEAIALPDLPQLRQLWESGQFQDAIALLQQALQLFQHHGDRQTVSEILASLAAIYTEVGQYETAIQYYQQALPLQRANGDRAGTSNTLANLGTAYSQLGRDREAIAVRQDALPIQRQTGNLAGETATLYELGLARARLGRHPQAIDDYQQALLLSRVSGDRAREGLILHQLGQNFAAQQQPELAIIHFKQASDIFAAIQEQIDRWDGEWQQLYAETVADNYRQLADLLLQENRLLEAQRVLDLLKVQELDDYLDEARAVVEELAIYLPPERDIIAAGEQLRDRAVAIGTELAQLRRVPPSELTAAQDDLLIVLDREYRQLVREFTEFTRRPDILAWLDQLSETAREQNLNLNSLRDLASDLQNLDTEPVLFYPLILADRLELLIALPGTPPLRHTVPVERAELVQAIEDLRRALNSPGRDAQRPAQQLYQWLIAPLEADLRAAETDTILYAPDAQLRYIPLAALHDGEQWLVERFEINNITAQSLDDWQTPPSEQMRLLAGAFVKGRYRFQVGGQDFAFAGLPAAGQEIAALAALMPNTDTFVDEAFNRTLLPRLDSYAVVHFATHAALVPGQPEDSFILLGDGDRISLGEVRDEWQFNNLDLIVLSACQTGMTADGWLSTGEEILGFGYLMQRAGARAAIASLWAVSDGGTEALMTEFYEALQVPGTTKAAALRQAQLVLLATGEQRSAVGLEQTRAIAPEVAARLSHPYYWAPFILIGNGL